MSVCSAPSSEPGDNLSDGTKYRPDRDDHALEKIPDVNVLCRRRRSSHRQTRGEAEIVVGQNGRSSPATQNNDQTSANTSQSIDRREVGITLR